MKKLQKPKKKKLAKRREIPEPPYEPIPANMYLLGPMMNRPRGVGP